ncbi:MAG: endonuclease/exonuclease/phosphatase family protein [Firmicutes bacterium]|nr:endonuclease/exonuclease/phosphatase family protein [Bacillota bacterium]
MRKYAYLKKNAAPCEDDSVCKIMLCDIPDDGIHLFEYDRPDAETSSFDIAYDSLESLYSDWNDRIDAHGWQDLEDPLPDCLIDAFIPVRIKDQDSVPGWRRETLQDGQWVAFDYDPVFDIGKWSDAVSPITVVSANVRCHTDSDQGKRNWYYRAPLMVHTLINTHADIIGLQECMQVHYDRIGRALRGYGSFIDYRDDSGNPEGCPIFYNLSKFELTGKGTFWLSETPDRMSKGWGAACYRTCSYVLLRQKADGKELAVFNTHLDHVSEEARINGIRLILQKLREFGGMPCVIMGDLNDFESSETYRAATQLFDDAKYRTDDTDSGATYHAWGEKPDYEAIDYFLVSKNGLDVLQYKVVRTTYNGVYPSDHYPIRLEIRLA